jgi:hypothetical protein
VAAPRLQLDLSEVSWPARVVYGEWLRLGYATDAHVGSGVYALSASGRARFDRFPDAIADDLFVRNLFAPSERVTVVSATFIACPPRTLRRAIPVKARVTAGNLEYARKRLPASPAAAAGHREARRRRLVAEARTPRRWVPLAMYASYWALVQREARRQFRRGPVWHRDDSSREPRNPRAHRLHAAGGNRES